MENNSLLEMKNVTKLYHGVTALDNVSLTLHRGEVLALLGENGAGKSTMIKVLSGAIEPTEGTIIIEGKSYNKMTPALSKELGIGVIYQELVLWPKLCVYENIFVGQELRKGPVISAQQMIDRTNELINRIGVPMDPRSKVRDLTVAYQQIVAIMMALNKDVKILVMDEPTATLTQSEVDILFGLVKKLKTEGVSVIFISHRMDEIYEIADRVTVIRDGHYIDTLETKDASRELLISLMVGRQLNNLIPERSSHIGEVALEVKNLNAGKQVQDISFKVHKGEVLGLAGLVGAGRTETVRAIFGIDELQSGEIFVNGKHVTIKAPADAIRQGMALLPEDRKDLGVLLKMSVRENISFVSIKDISHFLMINKQKDIEVSQEYIDSLKIKTPSLGQKVRNLSGGNQQKVVLAKWLASKANIIIFDEPTRGIDVGAKYEIYELMNRLTEQGAAIIMISSEMPELIGMADRVVVMHEGRKVGELNKEEISQEAIASLWS